MVIPIAWERQTIRRCGRVHVRLCRPSELSEAVFCTHDASCPSYDFHDLPAATNHSYFGKNAFSINGMMIGPKRVVWFCLVGGSDVVIEDVIFKLTVVFKVTASWKQPN